jgi:selenocysteine lyase/cysteine desulfurase
VTTSRRSRWTAEDESARAVAGLLATSADRIALTDSTTMGLGLVYGSFRAGPGDELLTTEHDHYSTHESLRHSAAASGARLRKVRLYPPEHPERATAAGMLGALDDGITRRTRLLACTWVHSGSGVRLPLRDVATWWPATTAGAPPRGGSSWPSMPRTRWAPSPSRSRTWAATC